MNEPQAHVVASNSLLDSAIGLLRIANCPDCSGLGFVVREIGGCDMDGENDTRECVQEQCRWCYEREGLLAEYDKANAGGVFPKPSGASVNSSPWLDFRATKKSEK